MHCAHVLLALFACCAAAVFAVDMAAAVAAVVVAPAVSGAVAFLAARSPVVAPTSAAVSVSHPPCACVGGCEKKERCHPLCACVFACAVPEEKDHCIAVGGSVERKQRCHPPEHFAVGGFGEKEHCPPPEREHQARQEGSTQRVGRVCQAAVERAVSYLHRRHHTPPV